MKKIVTLNDLAYVIKNNITIHSNNIKSISPEELKKTTLEDSIYFLLDLNYYYYEE